MSTTKELPNLAGVLGSIMARELVVEEQSALVLEAALQERS
jgi:hypothetical protein